MGRKKGKSKPLATAAQRLNSIGATAVRINRGEIVTQPVDFETPEGKRVVIGNIDHVQDYIARYWRQGALTDRQWKAGNTFARDAEAAQVGVPSQLGKRPGGDDPLGGLRMAGLVASAAYRRTSKAMAAAGDKAAIVVWVAAHGRGAHEWATEQRLAPTEGIRLLRVGLDRIADHYGIDK